MQNIKGSKFETYPYKGEGIKLFYFISRTNNAFQRRGKTWFTWSKWIESLACLPSLIVKGCELHETILHIPVLDNSWQLAQIQFMDYQALSTIYLGPIVIFCTIPPSRINCNSTWECTIGISVSLERRCSNPLSVLCSAWNFSAVECVCWWMAILYTDF